VKTVNSIILSLLFAVGVFISSLAVHAATNLQLEWVTPAVSAPRVTQAFFESRAGGVRVSYHIYLPAHYAQDAQRRFPVVYWLHGSGGGVAEVSPGKRVCTICSRRAIAGVASPSPAILCSRGKAEVPVKKLE
jgi:predicted peptidase